MLVWLNKDRNRSNSNSSNSSVGKTTSQKLKPKQSQPQDKNPQQKLNMSELITSKQKNIITKQAKINLYTKYNLPKSRVEELYTIFYQFDEDEDGVLEFSQFQKLMEKGHQQIKITTARDIIYALKGKNLGITFQDFIIIILKNRCQLDSEEQLTKVFKSYDKKNKGYFDFEDYLTISKTFSQEFSMEEMEQAFNLMDQDNDGRVTYEEFKKSISRSG